MRFCALLSLAVSLVLSSPSFAKDSKESIPAYVKVDDIKGNLNSIGSDTLNNLMTYWAEGFKKIYPNARVQVEGKGSSTAPPALIAGVAQLGPMSRAMKNKEKEAFEKKYGFMPTKVAVAVDSLAVYVHKDNPIKSLTLQQVDAIFSKNRKGKYPTAINTWGDLGLKGKWANAPISLYGRNSASGTYGYFKKKALFKGDFRDSVKEQPGSATVVNGIGGDLYGIGYSGIGYITSNVRAVPLAKKPGKPSAEASFENALNGKYPLGRSLYVYIVKDPTKPLPVFLREFLKFILSKKGQDIVVKDGYGRLPRKVIDKQMKMLR